MKYLLDIVLVALLVWMGYLWNGEKKNGLELGEEISRLEDQMEHLQKEKQGLKTTVEQTQTDLDSTRAALESSAASLASTQAELEQKTNELASLTDVAKKLKTRVVELEGYKGRAIVAEMPATMKP